MEIKVKELEWIDKGDGFYLSKNRAYEILKGKFGYDVYCFRDYYGQFQTLKESNQKCQEHFKKFIVSNIKFIDICK